jgi:hypothetical protein
MNAVRPWHFVVLFCCFAVICASVGAGVLIARMSNRRK